MVGAQCTAVLQLKVVSVSQGPGGQRILRGCFNGDAVAIRGSADGHQQGADIFRDGLIGYNRDVGVLE